MRLDVGTLPRSDLATEVDAGAPERSELVLAVAHMVAEWETSDEQPTDFARRLVAYVADRLDTTSSANSST